MAGNGDTPSAGFAPETYCPEQVDGVCVFDRGPSERHKRFVLVNRQSGTTLQITDNDKLLWELFDGTRTVNDLCHTFLEQHKALVLTRVYTLLELLWNQGMLRQDPRFANSPVGTNMFSRIRVTHLLRLPLPGTSYVMRAFGAVLKHMRLSSNAAIGASAVLFIIGTWFLKLRDITVYPILRFSQTYSVCADGSISEGTTAKPTLVTLTNDLEPGILLLIGIWLLCSLVRELFRGSVTAALSGESSPLKIVFNYGLPAFESPKCWRVGLPLRERVIASCSGLLFELGLAAVAIITLQYVDTAFHRELLAKLILVLLLRSFLHFSPSTASDLHGIMVDWGDMPNFRKRALRFLKVGMPDAIFGDRKMSHEQRFFLTYNLLCVAWLVLAAKIGLEILMLENTRQTLQAVLNRQSHSSASLLIASATLLPIILSLGLTLGWGLYVAYVWISSQSFVRKPANVVLTAGAGIIAFPVIVVGMEKLGQIDSSTMSGIMYLANLLVLAAGIWISIRNLQWERKGNTRSKLWMMAFFFTFGMLQLVTDRYRPHALAEGIDAYGILCAIYLGLMLVTVLLYVTCVVYRELHFIVYWRTRYALPEASMTLGIVIFELCALIRIAGLFLGGDFPEFTACTFAAYSLVTCGMAAWLMGIRQTKLLSPGLAIDSSHDEKRSLVLIGNHFIQRIGQICTAHFGTRCVGRLEKLVASKVLGKRFSFDSPSFPKRPDTTEIGLVYQDILLAIDDAISTRFSCQFAQAAYNEAFSRIHWRGKVLFEKFVLKDTPWQEEFVTETAMPGNERCRILRDIGLFDDLAERQVGDLADNMTWRKYSPGEAIIEQDRAGDSLFVIISGEAQVVERDVSGERQIMAILKSGDFFGETALLANVRRSATINAITDLTALSLRRVDFEKIARRSPAVAQTIRTRLKSLRALMNIPLFHDLPLNLLRGILPRVKHLEYATGSMVFAEGDPGDRFYLIEQGAVAVIKKRNGTDTEIGRLNAGECFGEIALLQNIPRTAGIRCETDCSFASIEGKDFQQLSSSSHIFTTTLRTMGEIRSG